MGHNLEGTQPGRDTTYTLFHHNATGLVFLSTLLANDMLFAILDKALASEPDEGNQGTQHVSGI